MLRLVLIAAVLFGAGAAKAEAQTSDARAIAFRDDCASTLSDLAATKLRVRAAGWVAVDPSVDPELKAVHNITMGSMHLFPGATVEAFSRVIGDHTVYMMISGNVPTLGTKANGCYVYDFADDAFAADPDADRTLEMWLGAPPTEALSRTGTISNKQWVGTPSHPEFATVRTASVPGDSIVIGTTKFSGRAWAATAEAQ
jgi:hypothetical protein